MSEPTELSERDREILEFERLRWKHAGAKEEAIRDRFDMSSTRYSQVLLHLISQPAALEYDAQLVNRLLRLRARRRQRRSMGSAGSAAG